MILAIHQAMEAYCQKLEFNVHNADRGVSFHFKVLAAELYGCCRCVWPLPMCMATADVYGHCQGVWLLPCFKATAVSAVSAVYYGRLSLYSMLIVHFQSGNMTNQLYSVVAQDQLMLPANPVSCHRPQFVWLY
jgi:hypothetical protein